MFNTLSERLERSFKILKGEGRITEINIAETLKDVRRALLDADVNYKVAKTFTDTVKQKALGQNVINELKPKELMVKIVHDELAALMGGDAAPLNIEGKPAVILMAGLRRLPSRRPRAAACISRIHRRACVYRRGKQGSRKDS